MNLAAVARAIADARDHMLEAQIAAQHDDWAELVDALGRAQARLEDALTDVRRAAA